MFNLPKFTTAKEIQKDYRRIFDEVRKTGEPVVVMRNNEPDVAIVDAKKLAEMEAIMSALQSKAEADSGKTKVLKGSLVDLWHEAQNH